MSPVADEVQYVSAKEVRNKGKNRYSNILPGWYTFLNNYHVLASEKVLKYAGCPSKSWNFVITQDYVPIILCYFQDVYIYLREPFCVNMGGIAV